MVEQLIMDLKVMCVYVYMYVCMYVCHCNMRYRVHYTWPGMHIPQGPSSSSPLSSPHSITLITLNYVCMCYLKLCMYVCAYVCIFCLCATG